ncbi:MAG: ATP-grasp domain-containing protein [Deltaproteobacteria bacterium]|nr:ATP-grasp domain-containing protein [Deltaproteobacteria bacterium]
MKKIVILHSDISPDAAEDELDCLQQAEAIARALRILDYKPILLPFELDLNQTIIKLKSLKPQAVFNIVETLASKGSLIYFAPALLDSLRLSYTGCDTQAVFQTSNKPLSKKIMRDACVSTPDWIEHDGFGSQKDNAKTYLIKSSWEHASIGLDEDSLISYTSKAKILKEISRRKEKLGGSCYAEAYIDGREFNVALISGKAGVKVLPIAEMLFQDYAPDKLKIVDYRAKWVADSFEYNNTIRKFNFQKNDTGLITSLREIALRCWNLFSLRGYARVDFRVDNNGKPWVLEINSNPCLSPDAGFAAALEQAKIKYHDAIGLIIDNALKSRG